jgi:hypothetical protein
MTGKTPEWLDEWITAAVAGQVPLHLIERTGGDGEPVVMAEGDELSREQTASLEGKPVPPLSELQAQIIQLLGLPPDLYSRLSIDPNVTSDNAIGNSE